MYILIYNFVCIYVCMLQCTSSCMYVRICSSMYLFLHIMPQYFVCAYTYLCTYLRTYVSLYVYLYISMCLQCVYISLCVFLCVCVYLYLCIRMYVRMYLTTYVLLSSTVFSHRMCAIKALADMVQYLTTGLGQAAVSGSALVVVVVVVVFLMDCLRLFV